jgi:hypothetical protein
MASALLESAKIVKTVLMIAGAGISTAVAWMPCAQMVGAPPPNGRAVKGVQIAVIPIRDRSDLPNHR